jgi:cytokinin dehydrogenase
MKNQLDEQHKLSRRRFAQAVVGGSLIAGFDASSGAWVTVAEAEHANRFDALPPLDGVLRTDDDTRSAYARDYGNIVHERPRAVLSPGSPEDVAAMAKFARRNGLRMAARGQGHQPFGQAQVKDGIIVDVRSLHRVHAVTDEMVDVDAGADWSTVLSATMGRRSTPPVLTNYLRLTVGGTLSIGGIGIATFRYGAQVDHVRELQVVTGEGEVLVCSARERRDLFHAALAGQGQCGIITRAVLGLVPVQPMVREYLLPYSDLATLLEDQRALVRAGRVDGLVALVMRTPDGWSYGLQVVRHFTPPDHPDDAEITNGLRTNAAAMQTRDLGYEEFMNASPYTETAGAHADLGLLLPESAAVSFLSEALPRLTAADLGETMAMRVFVWDRSVFEQPLFRLPESAGCVYVAMLRAPATTADAEARALAGNRLLFETDRNLGGTLYPFGALELTRSDWRRHYADQWGALLEAKRRYDPFNLFASGPDLGAGKSR